MMMGYSQQQVVSALQQNRDDINRAVEYLLTQPPQGLDNDDLIRLDGGAFGAFGAFPDQKSLESKPSEEDKIAFI